MDYITHTTTTVIDATTTVTDTYNPLTIYTIFAFDIALVAVAAYLVYKFIHR